MDSSFNYNHHSLFFMNDLDPQQQEEKSSSESPPSMANLNNHHYTSKLIPSSSPSKKSRRGIHKRVVTVPMKEVEGSRLKGEISNNSPPSDSWAWRKYGQKPIKGSPYPRGYYRCSSSKGCPARKQVERSQVDPTLLLITYSAEHNHLGPTSRNSNTHHSSSAVSAVTAAASRPTCKPEIVNNNGVPDPELQHEEKFADLGDESLIFTCDEFSWFRDMETTSSTILECPIFAEERNAFFPMREEDESLFADLGELPECSIVLRSCGPTDTDVDPRPHYVVPRAEILGHVSI